MKYLMILLLFVASAAFGQTIEQPAYKLGETMANGEKCHEGIMQLLTLDPLAYGCDLDRVRSEKRALELNRITRERRYEQLEREENLRSQQPLK